MQRTIQNGLKTKRVYASEKSVVSCKFRGIEHCWNNADSSLQSSFRCYNSVSSQSTRHSSFNIVAQSNNNRKFTHRDESLRLAQRQSLLKATSASTQATADANNWDSERVVSLVATTNSSHRVEELGRPLSEYMALPASQYSVLDARKVERIDSDTFTCHVGSVNFFQFKVEPVLTLRVEVNSDGSGCEIKLLGCRITGSKFVESQNEKFSTTMDNVVRWRHIPDSPKFKELLSEITLRVDMEIPKWFRVLPQSAITYTGSKILQSILNTMVPSFLKQLERDYFAWANGDVSRKSLGDGSLTI